MSDTEPRAVERSVESFLADVTDEFVQALHHKQQPQVEDYAQRYPQIASILRTVLPALAEIHRTSGEGISSSQPSDAIAGRLGDFTIHREVGRGGMGIVYEAEQISLSRRVALKVLPFAAVLDERQLTRFKNEARAAATLHHPNIVPVFSVGCDRGVHFYAMQFIEGQSLAEIIHELRCSAAEQEQAASTEAYSLLRSLVGERRRTSTSARRQPSTVDPTAAHRISEGHEAGSVSDTSPKVRAAISTEHSTKSLGFYRTVAQLGIQAAEALEHAHQNGVTHRDIKPSNLMLDGKGKLWITDFGLARLEADAGLTMTGDILGTLRYMSPEQALGKHAAIDQRTDIYSLGATLYELLTRRPVFNHRDHPELLRRIAADDPVPPRRINPTVPIDLETIVLKTLAKNPADRYESAGELADDLRRYLGHLPVRAKRPTISEHVVKWMRRHPAAVRSVAAILAALAISSAVAALLIGSAYRREAKQLLATEEQRDTAVRNLYLAHMRQLAHDWEFGLIDRLSATLKLYEAKPGQPDLRGWEWYYYKSLLHRDLMTLRGHQGPVRSVSWQRSAERLASCGDDGTIRLWNTSTGNQEKVIHSPGGALRRVAWRPGHSQLVTTSTDGTVRTWNALTGKLLSTIPRKWGKGSLDYAQFSPDGEQLLVHASDAKPRVVNVGPNGAVEPMVAPEIATTEQGTAAAAWDPDNRLIASGQGDYLQLRDAVTGEVLSRIQRRELIWATSLAWSPNTSVIAVGGTNSRVCLWDMKAGAITHEWLTNGAVDSVATDSSGRRLAGATRSQRIELWDLVERKHLSTLRGHMGAIHEVAWSSDDRLASASSDGTVKIWNTTQGQAATVMSPNEIVGAVAWRRDGKRLACGWRDGTVKILDPETGRILGSTSAPMPIGGIRHAEWSPDGKYLAWSHSDFGIVWSTEPKLEEWLRFEIPGIHSYSWAPQGSKLSVASYDYHDLQIWDVDTKKLIAHFAPETPDESGQSTLFWAAWRPDGTKLATGGGNSVLRIWDTTSWKLLTTMQGNPGTWVVSLQWSPDGKRLASAGSNSVIKIRDSLSGVELLTLVGHAARVWNVDWSADGKRLLSNGADQTLRIWDTVTGEEIMLLANKGVIHFDWSRDGTRIAASGEDGLCRIWDARVGYRMPKVVK